MTISRRLVLQAGTGLFFNRAYGAQSAARRVALANLHTGERVDVEYFRDGEYVPDSLTAIEVVLRDFRNGEQHPIDPKLMDYLADVAERLGAPAEFSVISGYRSPATNERLHERSSGVAQHSLPHARSCHRCTDEARGIALNSRPMRFGMKRGGVGYYRASDFVHLDTGAFRTWRG